MTAEPYTLFKSVTYLHKDDVTNNLVNGVVDFFRWGFLNVGGYQNITRSPAISGVYGGNRSKLAPVADADLNGKVWQGFRSDWVWESGVNFYPQPQPAKVYVGGSPALPTSGSYQHYIDYPRGRVVFNTTQSSSLNIEADFAHRTVSIFNARSNPIVQELMFNSFAVERDDFQVSGSGNWNQKANDIRRQLPLIGVEAVGGSPAYYPFEIGGGSQVATQDLIFHIFSENDYDLSQITDTVSKQNDKTIWLIDRSAMKADSRYPVGVDYKGRVVSSPITYPSLVADVSGFKWRTSSFSHAKVKYLPTVNNWLYRSTVRITCEVVVPQ